MLVPTNDERLFAMLLYLLSFLFPIVAPLVIWLIKKNESAFIDHHGKEYFNFLISYAIYSVVGFILMIVLVGFAILTVLGIGVVVFTIVAAIKAYEGKYYRIPMIIHFFK